MVINANHPEMTTNSHNTDDLHLNTIKAKATGIDCGRVLNIPAITVHRLP